MPLNPKERRYQRTVNAWALYDWANSAFVTTVMAGIFPIFYRSLATRAGVSESNATAYWAYTNSAALLIIAVIGPFLGALADHTGGKKRWLTSFAALGILATGLMTALGDKTYQTASALFIVGNIGLAGANIFYESLLPHIARSEDLDRVSSRGYAMGYLGGGLLLLMNTAWISHPEWFFMPGTGFAVRCAFFSVAIWWGSFTIPLLRHVAEPPVTTETPVAVGRCLAALQRLRGTAKRLPHHRQAFLFLIAFWIYNDGIGTIIKMATAYGDQIGIGTEEMLLALILVQFVGIPCSFAFGHLSKYIGPKPAILGGLVVYTAASIGGYFMTTAIHFFVLAFLIGLVQGGTQALSRSLYASMIPRNQAAEFFGFFSTTAKFAGIFGPLIFGIVNQFTGGGRAGILSLVVFFLGGSAVLLFVNEEEGIRSVRQLDKTASLESNCSA